MGTPSSKELSNCTELCRRASDSGRILALTLQGQQSRLAASKGQTRASLSLDRFSGKPTQCPQPTDKVPGPAISHVAFRPKQFNSQTCPVAFSALRMVTNLVCYVSDTTPALLRYSRNLSWLKI